VAAAASGLTRDLIDALPAAAAEVLGRWWW